MSEKPHWRDLSLTHFSCQPLGTIRSVPQRDHPDMKPRGLWVSIEGGGGGWSDWCEAESFCLEALVHAHDVTLSDAAEVLLLCDASDIDRFTEQFQVIPPDTSSARIYLGYSIDWKAVASKHHGIIIAPYIYERRLAPHTSWYYGWDCASGCIWDAAAIAGATLIERPKKEVAA